MEALEANHGASETDVLIYSDGPKTQTDDLAVREVREYVAGLSGFKSVRLIARERNLGLARSFIDGVTQTLAEYDRVIVLEDDNLTSPHFLRFMNEALGAYADDHRVISVSGYVYPARQQLPETFFIRGADSWGWATWRKGWKHFNPDGMQLLEELYRRRLKREFDFNDTFCFSCMLEEQIAGLNDSWAVRWYASAFLRNQLTLYPGRSLVQNIGNDATGTHSAATTDFDVRLAATPVRVDMIPVQESPEGRRAFEEFFREVVSRPHRGATQLRRFLGARQVVTLRRLISPVRRWRKQQ
jgi:glycosyltransferase involved in cell wall biosynthesis